jgi:uncharacterized membrane protein
MALIMLQYIPMGRDTAFLGIKQQFIEIPWYLPAFYIHVFTTIFCLPAGLTQFSKKIQKNYPRIHRTNGRIYVLAILLLCAPSGFIIGAYANGGWSSRIAFCLLAVLWFYFTGKAWKHAMAGNFRLHKAFMYRSFALTLSAITLRLWKYILVGIFHPRPMDVYQVIAWLGWTLNLLVAEWIIYKKLRA